MYAAIVRGAGFLGLWVVLIGLHPIDLAVGVFAAAAATWTSLRLLPPEAGRIRFAVLVALSRVILGLHYPSDVLAGAVIGCALARAGDALIGAY